MGVLADAELLLQAKNYSGSGAWLDESGNGHDGQLGSTSGSDTNDPLFLEPDGGVGGTQYFWNPGSAGNYASSPDHARLDIVGDLDIRIKLAMDDWTPSGFAPIGPSKWQSAGQLSWNLYVRNTTGKLTGECPSRLC